MKALLENAYICVLLRLSLVGCDGVFGTNSPVPRGPDKWLPSVQMAPEPNWLRTKPGVLRAFTVQVWGCQKMADLRRLVVKSPGKGLHKLRVKLGLKWIIPSLRFHCHSQIRWARIPRLLCHVYIQVYLLLWYHWTPIKKHRTSGCVWSSNGITNLIMYVTCTIKIN